MPFPVPTPIYHITHLDNLPKVIAANCLCCCAIQDRRGMTHKSIAHNSIQDKRARTLVPCGPGGTLHDYVPFYFAPRSPMLYTIHRGNVPGYEDGQEPLVHLVTSAE